MTRYHVPRHASAFRLLAQGVRPRAVVRLLTRPSSSSQGRCSCGAGRRDWLKNMVRPAGVEPTTPGLGTLCSIRLSYGHAGAFLGGGRNRVNLEPARVIGSLVLTFIIPWCVGLLFPFARPAFAEAKLRLRAGRQEGT